MAERRMFAKSIVLADKFLDLPMSTRCLYMTFGMVADDDGFVNNPRSVMRQCGASDGDAKTLISEGYIIPFETGVIVITHWRLHNYLQKDRYKATQCKAEKAQLVLEDGAYVQAPVSTPYTECIQDVSSLYTQVSIGKDSIGKDSINNIGGKTAKRFVPPTLEEAKAYCTERHNRVDPERFIDFYAAKDWMIGKNKMKDWKAAIRNWERGSSDNKTASPTDYGSPEDFFA